MAESGLSSQQSAKFSRIRRARADEANDEDSEENVVCCFWEQPQLKNDGARAHAQSLAGLAPVHLWQRKAEQQLHVTRDLDVIFWETLVHFCSHGL